MRGLIIGQEPLDRILSGQKVWELRGSRTKIRGPIALIESGSGTVVGRCILADVIGPLSVAELKWNARRLGQKPGEISRYYDRTFAWVLRDVRRLARPIPYRHPRGAVIWVKLPPLVEEKCLSSHSRIPRANMRQATRDGSTLI